MSNQVQHYQNREAFTNLWVFILLLFVLLPSGCDLSDTEEVFEPKTRTAQFTIDPLLGKTEGVHPDNPEVTYTTYYMIATEDGAVEAVNIHEIDGFAYEEGYVYHVKLKVTSEPVVGDMILTGQRKSDWHNAPYCDRNYALIKVLSKTKSQ